MCERLKQAVLKTAIRETVSGVRIPLPPPSPLSFASSHFAVSRNSTPRKMKTSLTEPAAVATRSQARPEVGKRIVDGIQEFLIFGINIAECSSSFVVSSNTRAVALWESFGFAIVGRLPQAF